MLHAVVVSVVVVVVEALASKAPHMLARVVVQVRCCAVVVSVIMVVVVARAWCVAPHTRGGAGAWLCMVVEGVVKRRHACACPHARARTRTAAVVLLPVHCVCVWCAICPSVEEESWCTTRTHNARAGAHAHARSHVCTHACMHARARARRPLWCCCPCLRRAAPWRRLPWACWS